MANSGLKYRLFRRSRRRVAVRPRPRTRLNADTHQVARIRQHFVGRQDSPGSGSTQSRQYRSASRTAPAASVAAVSAAVHRLHGGRQFRAVAADSTAAASSAAKCGRRTARRQHSSKPTTGSASIQHYPIVYTVKIALTIAAMLFVLPGYRQFPFRISPLAIVVGVVGVVLWIWLCHLQLEQKAARLRSAWKASARPGRPAGVQPARTTRRHARLGLHVPGHPLPGPRARRADHRRVLPPRLGDAVRGPRELVGSTVRRSDAAGRDRRHGCSRC